MTRAILNHRYFASSKQLQRHGLPVTLQVREFGEFEDLVSSEATEYHAYVPLAIDQSEAHAHERKVRIPYLVCGVMFCASSGYCQGFLPDVAQFSGKSPRNSPEM